MDRREFGLLIKAMRYEAFRQQGNRWTQAKLARRVNATTKVISNLERGIKVNLEPKLLLRLADAFRLTSRERTVFFECASGLRLENVPRPGHTAEEILLSVLNLLRQYRLPAFVVDDYDNVVAANGIILHLFSDGWGLMDDAPQQPGGFNVMRVVFSAHSPLGKNISEDRESFLLQTVYFFRFVTLRCRATRAYQDMMEVFFAAPEMSLFRQVYLRSFQQKEDFLFEDGLTSVMLPNRPSLRFSSPPQHSISTPYGMLYVIAYLPADLTTLDYFTELAHASTGTARPLAPWPIETELVEDYGEQEEFEEAEAEAEDDEILP